MAVPQRKTSDCLAAQAPVVDGPSHEWRFSAGEALRSPERIGSMRHVPGVVKRMCSRTRKGLAFTGLKFRPPTPNTL